MEDHLNKQSLEVGCQGARPGEPPDPCVVVIFGATGDLAHTELIPSLYALACQGLLPRSFAIVGSARREWDDDTFREKMKQAVKQELNSYTDEAWQTFASRLFYVQVDIQDEPSGAYRTLKEKIRETRDQFDIPDNVLFHFSTAPSLYGTIVEKLDAASLLKQDDGWRRVVIEKPFGQDEESARRLDRELRCVLDEEQVYRVDHYLGKETVQNMLVFRFANPGFEPIWNRNYIDHVQITAAENAGIGTRAGFYEQTGVVRDMVQNHLLQLLCMTAIEPPVCYDAESLRTETAQVLQAIRPVDVKNDAILGQYDKGEIEGEPVRGYRDEDGVEENSDTPTFVALKLNVDNWRWAGVPFYLRTGKRMNRKVSEVTIQFKPTPHLMFPTEQEGERMKNVLTFRLQPNEGIIYTFLAKQPGADIHLEPVRMNFQYDQAFEIDEPPSAYQWLLLDAMQGDQTLFPRSDWILKAWSIVDPIVKEWESEPWLDLPNYAAGSWGPTEADELLRRDGREWKIL
ncbi:glucose-6-phosphate dehydrogenase [candidate division KSB1 bacterium]|nr:glucose-6-phosphate dehydrogenase [candidate division KSB1 bacterium]NIR70848.1 glucose-6-phosphate dehydrogenase [candidate division KSB1 bacterium]NIS24634.1 glucose-6-phosphate dehydrogenase [candidate division KSB1 bacterium]NIT71536.1 glucose-6-phosphate dehydrogenase [candidate division KSB1 bacterium]NIU25234.1 glucose-6-phosphate dehydrogenase [candidate division KSB1 bacterium]